MKDLEISKTYYLCDLTDEQLLELQEYLINKFGWHYNSRIDPIEVNDFRNRFGACLFYDKEINSWCTFYQDCSHIENALKLFLKTN